MKASFFLVLLSGAVVLSLLHLGVVERKRINTLHDIKVSDTISSIDRSLYTLERPPANLADLHVISNSLKKDIEKYNIEYSAKDASSYEVCGTFRTKQDGAKSSSIYGDFLGGSDFSSSVVRNQPDPYTHEAGRQCFDYTVAYSSFPGSSTNFGDEIDFNSIR